MAQERVTVEDAEAGERLDRVLAARLAAYSRTRMKHLVESGQVMLEKPAGLVVHPAPGNLDRTLVNALLAHCGDSLAGIGGVKRPGIVHRLDKDTSGLLVIAKTDLAHQKLSADFAARRLTRAYLAVVRGVPNPGA